MGLGWLPVAPGTWGSLPVALGFGLLAHFIGLRLLVPVLMGLCVIVGSLVCLKCADVVIAATGSSDPPEVVADEFAGQALVFVFVGSFAGTYTAATAVLGFLLFRLFDIVKPWPTRRLERLPGGWGVLADDLMAGIYAAVSTLLCLKLGIFEYLEGLLGLHGQIGEPLIAILLGCIQGITEFLPVSSSGHLVLFETFFKLNPENPAMLLFDLAVHLGTVVAILVVFRSSIAAFLRNLISSGKYLGCGEPSGSSKGIKAMNGTTCGSGSDTEVTGGLFGQAVRLYRKSPSIHLLFLAMCATFVTAVIGLLFEDYFTAARGNLGLVAAMWGITGTLLIITDRRRKTRLSLRRFAVWQAVIVGLAQAIAIIPGISRSGATICSAILLGLHRRWAVEFSFLLAIPAIIGAATAKLLQDYEKISLGGLAPASLAIGAIAAAVTGIAALKLLIRASRKANLKFFAFYCYALACFVVVYYLLYH